MAQAHRPARRAHPGARRQGQLLGHGRARSRWPVLGDLLRPRPGVRPRGRPGRGRGPLHRNLEPRLHAGRPRRPEPQARAQADRRAAEEEHRHRHGCRARRNDPAGRRERLRDRPGAPGHRPRRGVLRAPLRLEPRRRRPLPRDRRPRPHRRHADRRRRHPGQRRPRLRAAPPPAPHRPLFAPAGRARAGAAGVRVGRPRHDGPDLPRAGLRLRPDQRGRPDRGRGVPLDPDQRLAHLRPRGRGDQARRRGRARRRQGVPAARHVRLPDRPHPRDGGRAGPHRRRGRLPHAHERAAHPREGGRGGPQDRPRRPFGVPEGPGAARRDRVPRLHRPAGRGHGRRAARRRRSRSAASPRARRRNWSSTGRRSTPRAVARSPTPGCCSAKASS